jgi:hypothetical protein
MQLLYCREGAVVGWHDSAQNTPGTDYGTGIRVVPYAGDIKGLPRFGPAPESGRDTRPYAQPVETPEILKAFSAQQRWEATVEGVVFKTIEANTDGISQSLIANLASYAATISPESTIDFTQNGEAHQITAQDAIDLNNQINAAHQQMRTIEAQCLADLNSAAPTLLKYEDVEARFADARKKK